MKKIIFLLVFFISANILFSQSSWEWNLVRENVTCWRMVSTPSNDNAFYVTSIYGNGERNNGFNYATLAIPEFLEAWCFENSTTGYAYHGDGGTSYSWSYFKKTTDRGSSWSAVSGPMSRRLYYTYQFSKINGSYYLVGQNPPYYDFRGFTKSNDLINWYGDTLLGGDITGIAGGTDGIYVSSWYADSTRLMFQAFNDVNWQKIISLPPNPPNRPYQNIVSSVMPNGKKVVFMAYGNTLIRYTEGSSAVLITNFEKRIGLIKMKDYKTVYFASSDTNSSVFQTKNSGDNWSEIATFNNRCVDLSVINSGLLVALGISVFNASVYYGEEVLTLINQNGNTVSSYSLKQNYPNPFNPATTINYSLPKKSHVTIKVFNLVGQELTTLVNGTIDAGEHSVNFNAGNLSSGVYLYTLTANNKTSIRKMTLVK